jgi:hypothetical protein
MPRIHKALMLALSPLLFASPGQAEIIRRDTPVADPTGYVNLSPLEGWTFQVSAPLVFGSQGASPSVGVMANKTFPIGQLAPDSWWSKLGLGIGANVFAPLSFQQLYLGASVGLGQSTPIAEHFIDYGLRYAPLVAIDWAANTSTGYNGLLANLAFHYRINPNTYTTLGLQGGFYLPFTGGSQTPIWVLQPLLGLNLGF